MNTIKSEHWVSDEDTLEAYVLQKIDEEKISKLSAHLEKCEECRKRVQEERELRAGIQKFGRIEMKRRLKIRLRRDRSRRLEWTHVASIAAAIVVVFSAVLTVRWVFDVEGKKTQVREIVLQESKPAEQAMWIIGKVIKVKDNSGPFARFRKSNASIADNGHSGIEANQTLIAASKAELDETVAPASEKSQATISEKKAEQDKEIGSEANEALASKDIETRADVSSQPIESPTRVHNKKSDSKDSISPQTIVSPTLAAEDKLESRIGYGANVKRGLAPKSENKLELNVPAPTKAKTGSTIISTNTRQNKKTPAVFVYRGDMKDLPVSMRDGDASVIHTRMERTPKGLVLTFYSSIITDSVASDIEAIGQDSIIVTFRGRQIAYYIPGGWVGKM